MGIYQEKYTKEYFTGVDEKGAPVGYGAEFEKDDDGIWVLRRNDREILDAIDFSGKRILDVGFGRGEAISYAYLNGAVHCTGVDFSEAAVSLANELISKRKLPEAELYHSDAYTFICETVKNEPELIDHKVDVVIMLDVIEHIPRTELRKILACLKSILATNAILVINTPAYKYDNDVIENGYDERNMEDCIDTSDIVPETKGMHCNKYTTISLQKFMSDCGYINLSEAHFFVDGSLFSERVENIENLAYSERWNFARDNKIPLQIDYRNDIVEAPYKTVETPSYFKFKKGNLAGLTLLLTSAYRDIAFPAQSHDEELFVLLQNEDLENKVIFDVGAFIGVNSLLFAKLSGTNGQVISFEPNTWNRSRIFLNLSQNRELARRITVYEYAISDKNNSASMIMSSEIDNGYSSTSRIQSSHPKTREDDLPPGFFREDVKIRTLDWFVEKTEIVPDIIKVDIEGAEHLLLRGGLNTIQQEQPILFIELHSEFSTLQSALMLQELGYQFSVIKEEPDNRILVKAAPGSQMVGRKWTSIQNKYLEIISYQNDLAIQSQSLAAKEQTRHQALQQEYQASQQGHTALQKDHQTLQQAHQAMLQEYEALKQGHQALQQEHQALQQAHQAMLEEYEALKQGHAELQQELQSQQQAHQAMLEEYEALKQGHAELQQELQTLQQRLAELQKEHHELQHRRQSLEKEHQLLSTDYQGLINSKTLRYANRLKAILGYLGIKRFRDNNK